MGSDDGSQAERPRHRVRMCSMPFYLGIHTITQRQYRRVMDDNPSHFKGWDDRRSRGVCWLYAIEFCNMLSDREGLDPITRRTARR